VILTRPEGERQEIDLVAPMAPTSTSAEHAERAELQMPGCPLGAVTGLRVEEANGEPPPPGASPLVEGPRRIDGMSSAPFASAALRLTALRPPSPTGRGMQPQTGANHPPPESSERGLRWTNCIGHEDLPSATSPPSGRRDLL
jgi:hypothetical protein